MNNINRFDLFHLSSTSCRSNDRKHNTEIIDKGDIKRNIMEKERLRLIRMKTVELIMILSRETLTKRN